MKKFLLAAAIVSVAFVGANAEDYAPAKGDFGVEVGFNPFDGQNFNLNDYQIKGRWFMTGKDALVFQIGIDGVNNKNVKTKIDGDNTIIDKDAYTSWYKGAFNIDLGYERHFYNYKRVDLYAGGRIGFGTTFAGEKANQDANNSVQYINYTTTGNTQASNDLRLAVFTGLDFYVYKGLYVGAELGLNMVDHLYVGTKRKVSNEGKTKEYKTEKGGHNFDINTFVTPTFRLGWTF